MNKIIKVLLICIALLASNSLMAQKRNVLFIAVDDLKPLLGAYGDDVALTPNIDKLAAKGTTFTNNHCQQAVCAPSRASLLTGLRPDLTEVWDLKTMIRDKNENILTLPQHFKNNGYETVGIGKIYDPRSVDKGLDKRSWSKPYFMPEPNDPTHGEPALGSYQSIENKKTYEKIKAEGIANGLEKGKLGNYIRKNFKPSTESFDIADEGYADGMFAKEAINQLAQLAKGDKPFMLCVGFKKPHLPFVAPTKYWDLYQRSEMKLAAYQKKASNTTNLPYHKSGELRSYTDIPSEFGANGLLNEDKQRELIHGYYASISYIDALIGKIMDELEAQGLSNNTTIVLWGDHGWHLGDHGMWNKHSNFEQATRSPMIFVAPDMAVNKKNNSPTEFIDIFPTLCDLTDLPQPQYLQGKSLKPILRGKAKKVKDFAISQFGRAKNMGYALRNERYRYVAWYKDRDISSESKILAKELYDYKNDPLEKENIVSKNRAVADELQAQLTQFLKEEQVQKRQFKKGLKSPKEKIKMGMNNANSDNLIKNAGFEEANTAWSTFGECTVGIVKEGANTGDFSLKFEGNKCGANQVVKNLKPNTTYKLSAFIKTENNQAVIMKIAGFGGEAIKEKYKASSYGMLKATFTTGQKNKSVKIIFQKYGKGNGSSWVDDVVLVEELKKKGLTNELAIKDIVKEKYQNKIYIGASIGYNQLKTDAESILTSQFNYTVTENAVKQTRVHPTPNEWNWEQIDGIVAMAKKNNLTVRLHGPISPQASKWAKADNRTGKELEKVMTDYMTRQCKRFNGHPNIKWMDVVNETVERDGTWFGPKLGVKEWENPWTIIGSDTDANKTPIYISKAFEIANEYAPDISLVYNQHGAMEPIMWEKVKQTILYLKKKNLRVDGIGWQAHLASDKVLAFNQKQLDYLSSLIDWAHTNDLDFHVTEIDYKIPNGKDDAEALQEQADAYANILKILLSKRTSGVVTYNTWGIHDGIGKHADKFMFMFDEQLNPKPAYFAIKEALKYPTTPLVIAENETIFTDGFESSDLTALWVPFGKIKPTIGTQNTKKGQQCLLISHDKSGIKRILKNLKPQTNYQLEAWVKAPSGLSTAIKISSNGKQVSVKRVKGNGQYKKVLLAFMTDDNTEDIELLINRWNNEKEGLVFVDEVTVYRGGL